MKKFWIAQAFLVAITAAIVYSVEQADEAKQKKEKKSKQVLVWQEVEIDE